MQRVPAGVEVGNFVGKKFDEIHDASYGNDSWMREHVQILRQVNKFESIGNSQRSDGSIQIDSRGPRGPHSQAQGLKCAHKKLLPDYRFDVGVCRNITLTVRDRDRKSTRLNSSHMSISYAVFCLKK